MIATVDQTWRLPAPDGLFLAFLDGAVRTAALLRAQTPDALFEKSLMDKAGKTREAFLGAHGGLYTLSQHVTPPLTYAKVIANLNRMMRGLTAIEPSS